MTRRILLAVTLIGLSGTAVHAQAPGDGVALVSPQSPALAAIDSLVDSSRFRDATAALDRWERENATSIVPGERASALLLRARLTQDADSARDMYLSLSLGYPSAPEAAVALLRLGQLAFAQNDAVRAASYFERIVADHARSPVHATAVAWLARTAPTAGASRPTAGASRPTAGAAAPVVTRPVPAPTAVAGSFALQLAAFRNAASAQTLVRRLATKGFEARAVVVPANQLVRVRVGRFDSARAVGDMKSRLAAAGFEAVVVDDAGQETVVD